VKTYIILSFVVAFTLLHSTIHAQKSLSDFEQDFSKCIFLYDNKEFEQALQLLLVLDTSYIEIPSSNPTDSQLLNRAKLWVKYNVALCYTEMLNKEWKALPYLVTFVQKADFEIPNEAYFIMGTLYHQNYQYQEAINYFRLYLAKVGNTGKNTHYVNRMIDICKNAPPLPDLDTLEISIENVGVSINTNGSESTPLVSADDSLLYYSSIQFFSDGGTTKSENHIYVSVKDSGYWQSSYKIEFNEQHKQQDISLAGLSPDGKLGFFCLKSNNRKFPYYSRIRPEETNELTQLDCNIEPEYWSGSMSITADGTEIYFSSNRPEGKGGYDIYKTVLMPDGTWSEPINLGDRINTSFNETAPFIHPTKEFLIFSSDGHNTIGGYDIFKAQHQKNKWVSVENLGFPINTVKDNIVFTISASGKIGYFAASHYDQYDTYNIYAVNYNSNIPVTLLKGKILDGETLQPIQAKITVFDSNTKQHIDYPYTPDTFSGEYMVIVPPGKRYDILFEAEGYSPQLVTFKVPNQKYFYQLYQEIHLHSKTYLDSVEIEEIVVRNLFYDVYNIRAKDNTKEYKLMMNLVSVRRSINYDDFLQLQKLVSPTTDELVDDKNYPQFIAQYDSIKRMPDQRTYDMLTESYGYYDDIYHQAFCYTKKRKNDFLQPITIGNDTVLIAPPVKAYGYKSIAKFVPPNVAERMRLDDEAKQLENHPVENKYFITYSIYFKQNKFDVNEKDNTLNLITELLHYKGINAEIKGYLNERETVDGLADKRVDAVLAFFNRNYVPINKIHRNPLIVKSDITTNIKETQKVEIRLYNEHQK